MILSTEYKDYTINYDTYNGSYQVIKKGGVVKESKRLEVIEKFLESGEKEKKKFKRVSILVRGVFSVQDLYIKGQATSVADERGYNGQPNFWIINEKGKREKESNLLLDISANHALIDQIKAKRTEKKKIDDDIEAIKKGFQYLTPEMMEENKED